MRLRFLNHSEDDGAALDLDLSGHSIDLSDIDLPREPQSTAERVEATLYRHDAPLELVEKVLAGRSSVTEGVATAPALIARARNLDMPICQAVAALVTNRASLSDLMAGLLARPRRDE